VPQRKSAFVDGLRRAGYEVVEGLGPGDLLVTWNRIGAANRIAEEYEAQGKPVIVVENATWGNDFQGRRWYHLARSRHNTAGMFPVGSSQRWDNLGVTLRPFRSNGGKLILPQRGIGSPPTAMPIWWPRKAQKRYEAPVRRHPGQRGCEPLEQALEGVETVYTWGSGAAIKALMLGCRVYSDMPDWIGWQDNTEAGRLAMFRRLAWAQWTLDEIASGQPIRRLLDFKGLG
jgi:hypothetical protein